MPTPVLNLISSDICWSNSTSAIAIVGTNYFIQVSGTFMLPLKTVNYRKKQVLYRTCWWITKNTTTTVCVTWILAKDWFGTTRLHHTEATKSTRFLSKQNNISYANKGHGQTDLFINMRGAGIERGSFSLYRCTSIAFDACFLLL